MTIKAFNSKAPSLEDEIIAFHITHLALNDPQTYSDLNKELNKAQEFNDQFYPIYDDSKISDFLKKIDCFSEHRDGFDDNSGIWIDDAQKLKAIIECPAKKFPNLSTMLSLKP